MREQLLDKVPRTAVDLSTPDDEPPVPEYETQDEVWSPGGDTDDDKPCIAVDVKFEELEKGDCVEVFWKGENKWYEGTITDLCQKDRTFEVFYFEDEEVLWHSPDDYPLRQSV